MAGGTTFDIAPRERGVEPTTAANTNGDEPRLQVGLGLKSDLVHIPAGRVAGGTERLLIVTRLALCRLSRSRDAVREAEVQIMHLGQSHTLSAVVGRQPGCMRRDQILARDLNFHQIDPVVAVNAGLLRMA
jgi:hypothetical protein